MIDIYQIFYKQAQLEFLSPLAKPYFNPINERSYLCEHSVFQDVYNSKKCFSNEYTGFVSWKFEQKSKIKMEAFLKFIEQNSGYDVYFINPLPWPAFFFRNIWIQGEKHHPGLLNLSQKILNSINYKVDLQTVIFSNDISSFCNYWVANANFWNSFMSFLTPIYKILDEGSIFTESEKLNLWSNADLKYEYIPHHTFILERLFTTFLYLHPKIKFKAFPITENNYLEKRYQEYSELFFIADNLKRIYQGRNYNDIDLDLNLNRCFNIFSKNCSLE